MKKDFLKLLQEKIIIADGAMGTSIQNLGLSADDFAGLEGCNENLVLSRPEVIKDIHASFLDAGADLIETNTFGASALVLAEYGLAGRSYDIGKKAAQIAVDVAQAFSNPSGPRYVSGSVGPGTKLATLGATDFEQMSASYLPLMLGLLDGGVDLLQIETGQDLLQLKCAIITARQAMQQAGRKVPLCVTFTVETTGTMLIGTEVSAAAEVLSSLEVDVLGLNCATGPDLMQEHVRILCENTPLPVAVLPNAGLPRIEQGRAFYDLTADAFAEHMAPLVCDFGVSMVGGCCGTTAAHIAALHRRFGSLAPKKREVKCQAQITSSYSSVSLDQEGSSPLIIDERCNANGSKQFRELLLAENWGALVEMAQSLVREGAHVLDVCAAYVGRNELSDMQQLLRHFCSQVPAPLMIDSTQPEVLEGALKLVGGRSIINSINLEHGEERLGQICQLAKKFGCALVALTIDEEGMAKSTARKLEIAHRIFKLCTEKYALKPEDLIFDPLTFTLASGDEDSRRAAIETLQALKLIKQDIPGVRTLLGVSNISFGLKAHARQVLNSVFLNEAIKNGLNAAIVHSKKILALHQLSAETTSIALDLIYDRRSQSYDPLFTFIEKLEASPHSTHSSLSQSAEISLESEAQQIEESLKKRIVDGRKQGIEALLERALEKYSALEIVNSILLEGMRSVGDLFARGETQLPFVLLSAETMKAAVSYLEKYLDRNSTLQAGSIVLATVRGDVHDIGKNLVDIILSNNGYKVINLGIKQPLENIIAAIEKHKPTAVGMSGLLVKSTLVMKENLELMVKRGISVPVICGGAALNRPYVDNELRAAYNNGPVFYAADAFSGLRIMNELCGSAEENLTQPSKRLTRIEVVTPQKKELEGGVSYPRAVQLLEQVPSPPFWGVRYISSAEIPLNQVFSFINKKALFAKQWIYRPGRKPTSEYRQLIKDLVEPKFSYWCERAISEGLIQPAVAYGYFPCQSEGDNLLIFSPEDMQKEIARIQFPRQRCAPGLCLADYFLPVSSARKDVVALQVVTSGARASEVCQQMFASGDYSDYLHFYGLSCESAEALAEYWHKRVRQELSIAQQDGATVESLFHQEYHGERFSFGYPACPRVEDQQVLFQLLEADRIGVSLSSEFQIIPEQSTSAIIVHHPQAEYFSVS